MAALQLFAHLEGEALNVALLKPEGERANREGLSQGLSNYYNSPGRLAVFRRKFESVTRRTGVDPATFATELEILAVWGFGEMGTGPRNRMVRDRFIANQWSCGLRRHLDSVPPDMPIREIVDHCRVWESHSEQKRGSATGTDLDLRLSGVSGDSRESKLFRANSLRAVGCPEVDSRIPVSVANVVQSDSVGPREAGCGCNQDAPPGILSSLIARLLRATQEDNLAEVKVPPDAGARQPSVAPGAGTPGRSQLSEAEPVMVCFSCGHPGHGMNRCSRVDTSFPFLPQGWSVDIRDGQYRAVWPGGSRARSPPGNEG